MKETKWLDDTPKSRFKAIKRKSYRQEKRIAKEHLGRTQAGSGAFMSKGDVKLDLHLIECKRTDSGSYTIYPSVLDKIRKEAIVQEDKIPALAVEIGNRRYVIIEACYL